MSQPLTHRQKATLSSIFRAAWLKLGGADITGMTEAEFRQHHAVEAVGCRISQASNRHFTALQTAALSLAGEAGKAFEKALAQDTEDLRVALHCLRREIAKANVTESYANAIARARFKRGIAELTSPREVQWLMFTIRKNAAALRRKTLVHQS